jgi:hypothetical protein
MAAGDNALAPKSLAYLVVWTAVSTVVVLYAFLGVLGSMRGKGADLEGLDPGIPRVGVSWKYVEPISVGCVVIVGLYLLSR